MKISSQIWVSNVFMYVKRRDVLSMKQNLVHFISAEVLSKCARHYMMCDSADLC